MISNVKEPQRSGFIHFIDKKLCKRCGICIYFCPKHILDFDGEGYPYAKNPENCIGCQLCFFRCPDFALEVTDFEY